MNDHHTAAVYPLLESLNDLVFVQAGDLVWIEPSELVEGIHQSLGCRHAADPCRTYGVGKPYMAGFDPAIQIQRLAAPATKLFSGLLNGVSAALDSASLMPAEPGDHLARPVACTTEQSERADRGRVEIVVRPEAPLLNADGRLRACTIDPWFGHQLRGADDILLRNAGHS